MHSEEACVGLSTIREAAQRRSVLGKDYRQYCIDISQGRSPTDPGQMMKQVALGAREQARCLFGPWKNCLSNTHTFPRWVSAVMQHQKWNTRFKLCMLTLSSEMDTMSPWPPTCFRALLQSGSPMSCAYCWFTVGMLAERHKI